MSEVAETAADVEEFDSILAGCARCHGRDGAGRPEGGVPWIGGQSQTFLAATLLAYAEGRRASGIMQPQAAAVPYEQLEKLAGHYGRQPWASLPDHGYPDPGSNIHGASIALAGAAEHQPRKLSWTARPPRTPTIHAYRAKAPASSRASWCCFGTARAAAPPMDLMPVFLGRLSDRTSPPLLLSMLRRTMLHEIRAAVVVADRTKLVRRLLLTALLGELVAFNDSPPRARTANCRCRMGVASERELVKTQCTRGTQWRRSVDSSAPCCSGPGSYPGDRDEACPSRHRNC